MLIYLSLLLGGVCLNKFQQTLPGIGAENNIFDLVSKIAALRLQGKFHWGGLSSTSLTTYMNVFFKRKLSWNIVTA